MDESFEIFMETFGPAQSQTPYRDDSAGLITRQLPTNLIDFWREVGWAGFSNGLVWSTNPDYFSPAVESWLGESAVYKQDDYVVIARSAFGEMYLWGLNSGANISIDPLYCTITTSPPNARVMQGKKEIAMGSFFATKDKESFDFDDINEKALFKRAVKKLGLLEPDEMYAFEPALSIGGLAKLENLVKVKMVEHLVLLSQLADIQYRHIDVSRHLK